MLKGTQRTKVIATDSSFRDQTLMLPSLDDIVIAVMGITGAGKTTFTQQFCTHDLNVGYGLESYAIRRGKQLVKQNDLWKYLTSHGARVLRQDDGANSGKLILDYLVDRAQPVVLEIQHEMVDKGMKLSETDAGREVQEGLERMNENHEKEIREIREEMEEAVQAKDKQRQAELQEYRA